MGLYFFQAFFAIRSVKSYMEMVYSFKALMYAWEPDKKYCAEVWFHLDNGKFDKN